MSGNDIETAGVFIFYIIIKKEGLLLKMEDGIKSFVLHVSNEALPDACDICTVH